ncbi:hypothetical protein pb186bvf_019816 [Paramecium bursaria]
MILFEMKRKQPTYNNPHKKIHVQYIIYREEKNVIVLKEIFILFQQTDFSKNFYHFYIKQQVY